MPANVNESFARGVQALFPDAQQKRTEAETNVVAVWNKLASKFPKIYEFASFTRRIRATEEKIMLFLKLDPRVEADRGKLGIMFYDHLEHDTTNTLEGALDQWWRELSV